ncbi:MAG: YraN family protein, partial [Kiritimatiellales bacterium]|nr:YraN family protein [Kiritimatiellales bacterium]
LAAGRWGEQQAARFLRKKGWKILGKRVLVGKHDEIDIVAGHEQVIVFVEVKTRRNERFGRPFSAVNSQKRKRLSRAAISYLKKNRIQPDYIRFDAVEVVGEPHARTPEIRHIENAFQLDPSYKLWW